MPPTLLATTGSHKVWRMPRRRTVFHTVAQGGLRQGSTSHEVWRTARHRSVCHTLAWGGGDCRGSLEVTY